jgi:hypothetical protein
MRILVDRFAYQGFTTSHATGRPAMDECLALPGKCAKAPYPVISSPALTGYLFASIRSLIDFTYARTLPCWADRD